MVLTLSALLAAPAAGQTPLVDVPASADGPVHLSMAGVNRGYDFGARDLLIVSSQSVSTNSVPQVMGRGFRLVGVSFRGNTGVNPNRWRTVVRSTISATDLNELAVVVVGPAGTTPRAWRLSDQESTYTAASNRIYVGPVVSWAAQAVSDVNTHTSSLWTVLVVDHTDPGVNLDALTYTPPPPPPPPPPPAPSRVTGVRVAPRDGALHVSWSAAGGEVSQYRVHAEDGDGRFRRVYTDADVFEALVDGLVNGVDYSVTVTALTSHPDVEGPASEPRTVTPAAAAAGDTGGTPDPVPALPLAGAGGLAGLLAAGARRQRGARRRARRAAASR